MKSSNWRWLQVSTHESQGEREAEWNTNGAIVCWQFQIEHSFFVFECKHLALHMHHFDVKCKHNWFQNDNKLSHCPLFICVYRGLAFVLCAIYFQCSISINIRWYFNFNQLNWTSAWTVLMYVNTVCKAVLSLWRAASDSLNLIRYQSWLFLINKNGTINWMQKNQKIANIRVCTLYWP